MELAEAQALITHPYLQEKEGQTWLDLGCGSGLFTNALSRILIGKNKIIGIDNELQNLDALELGEVDVTFEQHDFKEVHQLDFSVDGILMANSLHFVEDKKVFLKNLFKLFKNQPQFIFVEYDTHQSNEWVPYPIGFNQLEDLVLKLGLKIEKMGDHPSKYHGSMYGAYVFR